MSLKLRSDRKQTERYDLDKSPLSQNPTHKQFAELLGLTKGSLKGIIDHKEEYIIRRSLVVGHKTRNLVYPFGKYRTIHEKLKYHFNKIKQPDYLFSPRKGKSIKSNAEFHKNQQQYLRIDIKQFYPSTTSEHVFRWAKYKLGMRDDVAGMFTHIATINGAVSFGSPLTPVLTSLVHRTMFDKIADECRCRGLKISVWVDDINISGRFIPGILLERIREIIRYHGLKSHKLEYSTGSRSVIVTGIAIRGNLLDSTRTLHNEISDGYGLIMQSESKYEVSKSIDTLLSRLGRQKYITGTRSPQGRKLSNRMNSIRQIKKLTIQ